MRPHGKSLLSLLLVAAPAARAEPPTVPGGVSAVLAGLSAEEIAAVVRTNMGSLRTCYAALLGRTPKAAGKVTLKFVIGSEGRVSEAEAAADGAFDAAFSACTKGALEKWVFPQPRGGVPVKVAYPIAFAPE